MQLRKITASSFLTVNFLQPAAALYVMMIRFWQKKNVAFWYYRPEIFLIPNRGGIDRSINAQSLESHTLKETAQLLIY